MNVGRLLAVIYSLTGYFERNGVVVDKEIRDVFIRNIPRAVVTDQVSDFVNEQLSKVDATDDKWEPLVRDSNVFVKLSKIHVKGESNGWGKAEAIINASAEEVRANK